MSRRNPILEAPREQSGDFYRGSHSPLQSAAGTSSGIYNSDVTLVNDSGPPIAPPVLIDSFPEIAVQDQRLSSNITGNEVFDSMPSISLYPSTIPELLGITREELDAYTKIREIMDKMEARKQKRKETSSRTNTSKASSLQQQTPPDSSVRWHNRAAIPSTVTELPSTSQASRSQQIEPQSVNKPQQTTFSSVRAREDRPASSDLSNSAAATSTPAAAAAATAGPVTPPAVIPAASIAASPPPSRASSASSTSTPRPIVTQMQVRKYQLQIGRNRLTEALDHFNSTINDESLPRSDRAAMIQVGSRFAKILIQEHSRHYEASQVLKTCLNTINAIGVQNPSEFTAQWEIHDDLATCYSAFENRPMEAEHYKTAIDLLSTLTVPPARYPHMMNNLGNCYKKMKKYEDAREMLEKAYKLMTSIHNPVTDAFLPGDYQKVLVSLADLYKSMKLNDKAITYYERIVNGTDAETKSLSEKLRLLSVKKSLAKVYRRVGLDQKADDLHVDEESGLETGELSNALGEGSTGSNGKSNLPNVLLHVAKIRKAQTNDSAGNNREAIRYYEMALADLMSAGPELDSAIDKPGVISSVHNNCGTCYISIGQYDKALEHLKEGLRIRVQKYGPEGINEDLATSYFNLGNLYRKWDREWEALPNYRHAAQIFGVLAVDGRSELTKWLLMTYRALKRVFEVLQKPEYNEEAKGYYQKAIDIYKKFGSLDQETRIEMSVFYEALGDETNALAILEE